MCLLGYVSNNLIVVSFCLLVPVNWLVGKTGFLCHSSDWLARSSPKHL